MTIMTIMTIMMGQTTYVSNYSRLLPKLNLAHPSINIYLYLGIMDADYLDRLRMTT